MITWQAEQLRVQKKKKNDMKEQMEGWLKGSGSFSLSSAFFSPLAQDLLAMVSHVFKFDLC